RSRGPRTRASRTPPSENPEVGPDAHRAEPYVQVSEADHEEAGPRPHHVLAIQAARAGVRRLTERAARELIDAAPHDVPHRMAAEQIAAEQHDVRGQHQAADADPEPWRAAGGVGKPETGVGVEGENQEHEYREEQQVTVDVLENQRERVLSPVAVPRLADRARRRVRPERLVVGA